MKWFNSPTGVPYVSAGGIMFILNDLSGNNRVFRWMVFSADFDEKIKTANKQTGKVRQMTMKRRAGCNIPLGIEFKLAQDMTRNFSKEEKELIGKVREWSKKKTERTRKELKFKK
jgi:hypothetical protein